MFVQKAIWNGTVIIRLRHVSSATSIGYVSVWGYGVLLPCILELRWYPSIIGVPISTGFIHLHPSLGSRPKNLDIYIPCQVLAPLLVSSFESVLGSLRTCCPALRQGNDCCIAPEYCKGPPKATQDLARIWFSLLPGRANLQCLEAC